MENYNTIVLYLNGTCNLNCTYCYIDKSKALKQIDELLEESFKSDYYLEFSKKIFQQQVLKRMEFWGGEPSLGLHRIYELLPKFLDYYPNLNEFMMSTNFTTQNWFTEFYGFLDILKKYDNRDFVFTLQLSIDGPEYINDKGRGKGTTQKFLEHLKYFEDSLPNQNLQNIKIIIDMKQTYTSETIFLLQTKDKIKDYFDFFDNIIDSWESKNIKNTVMHATVPNTAVPSPHTKEDGKLFANYCKITRELDNENRRNKIFKRYISISSFIPRNYCGNAYNCGGCTCGSGSLVVGLLPGEHLSACHNGFTNLVEDYKKNCELHKDWEERTILNNLFVNQQDNISTYMNIEEYKRYENIIKCFFRKDSTFQRLNLVALIRFLAKNDQIDKKYVNEEEALLAADYFLSATAYCIRDCLSVTGSTALYPTGLIKLLLNGAREYVCNR